MTAHSSALRDVYSVPRPGADFALHPLPPTEVLRSAVMENLRALDWNRYFTIPEQLQRNVVFGPEGMSHPLVLTRGAEAGMLALATSRRPMRIWVPEHSYPGYKRVAAAIQADLVEYRTLSQASTGANSSQAGNDWIVITDPGNPTDCAVPTDDWSSVNDAGFQLIVDSVYSMPGTSQFTKIVEAAVNAGGLVLFSFSKRIPLPGLRLGGIIGKESSQLPPIAHHHASVLDAAVLLALTEHRVMQSLAHQRLEVEHLHREIEQAVLQLGFPIRGSESGIFITTENAPIFTGIDGKRFSSGLLRAHSTQRNLETLLVLGGIR